MFDGGTVIQALVEMERGLMLVKSVSDGSSLAVLAAPESDMDLVAYEMTMLVEAVGDTITPATRI
jgi:predicted regulator of Ras-like GTPase activity (Roadblock/LC7/MglB family)